MIGEVSLTCDAWQAGNADAYFAVTCHWIEECAPGEWTVEQALLGFVQMNTAHNGARLGQALYKVCNRVQIVPKVSTNSFGVIQLTSGSIGRAYHLQQCEEQRYNASRIHTLLPPQDGNHVRCEASTHQVSPSYCFIVIYFSYAHSHRCLAHIINLATQAVITTCSKSKFYDGNLDNDELPEDVGASERDDIGIVHAICVKVSQYTSFI